MLKTALIIQILCQLSPHKMEIMVFTVTATIVRMTWWVILFIYWKLYLFLIFFFKLDTENPNFASNNTFIEHDENYLQKILKFGRELFQLSATLDDSENSANQKMLKVSFKLFLENIYFINNYF